MGSLIKGIVKSASAPREFNGEMQIGFTLEAEPKKWYNISGEEEVLAELTNTIIKRGNEIEFEYDAKTREVGDLKIIKQAEKKSESGSWEDDIVNFETLLNDAHAKFEDLLSIETQMIQIDLEKKYALFKATVTIDNKDNLDYHNKFEAHGDATEENVTGDFIKPHFIRMAETRAIVRALRWATNNAACAEEEKSDNPPKKKNETDTKKGS